LVCKQIIKPYFIDFGVLPVKNTALKKEKRFERENVPQSVYKKTADICNALITRVLRSIYVGPPGLEPGTP